MNTPRSYRRGVFTKKISEVYYLAVILLAEFKTPWNFLAETNAEGRSPEAILFQNCESLILVGYSKLCSNLFSKQMMRHAPSAWWFGTKSYARIVPPPPRKASADTKKKCYLLFGFARDQFFLKMERIFFFLGFCPKSFWAGGVTIWMSQMEKDGFGEEFSICSSFCFCENSGGGYPHRHVLDYCYAWE